MKTKLSAQFLASLVCTSLVSQASFADKVFSRVDVTGAEVYVDINKAPGEKARVGTDGPNFSVEAEFAKDALPVTMQTLGTWTLAGTINVNEALRIEDTKATAPILHGKVNWAYFFREAKVILDIDPKSGLPFATVIKRATVGIQDIETGALDSKMPTDDNSPLRGVTRIRGAQAFRIDLNNENFESLALAAYKTGVAHPETFGEKDMPSSPGVSLMMSKKLSNRWSASAGLSRIKFPEKAEVRINSGIAYENPEGGYKIFYNGAHFRNNPLYPDATAARTIGIIQELNKSGLTLNAENTRLNNGYRETAVGITKTLSPSTFISAGVRHTSDGKKFEVRLGATK